MDRALGIVGSFLVVVRHGDRMADHRFDLRGGYIWRNCPGASRKSAAGVVDTVRFVGLRVDASRAGRLAAMGGNVGAKRPVGGAARDGGPLFDCTDAFRVVPTACRSRR